MKILDTYKNRYLVEQTLPNRTLYEVYDLYQRVCSERDFDKAVQCWTTLISDVG